MDQNWLEFLDCFDRADQDDGIAISLLPKCEYNFLTKAISVLKKLELDMLIDEKILDRMKDEVGKRTKILILHDMRSICKREPLKLEGRNGEVNENYKVI